MKTILFKFFMLALLLSTAGFYSSCKKQAGGDGGPTTVEKIPQITSITPKNPQAGEEVTIAGVNFGNVMTDVKVTIGSTVLTISSVTPTEIKFTIPEELTSGDLALAIKNILATNKDPQGTTITVTPKTTTPPTFTAMTPNSGKTGDIITLTGTNFNPQISENKVFFATTTGGTVVLATIKTATATQLTVEVPANVITGGVLISVSGTNAVPATGFNTTFTVNATGGDSGVNGVSYINVLSGTLNYSKIASSINEIGDMYYDKVKNQIYYSDYSLLTQTGDKIYKLDPSGSSSATALTSDSRINKIVKLATDVSGNVYALKYEEGPSYYSIYKITPDGATVTEIIKHIELGTNGSSYYFFVINSANEICIRPDFKVTQSGQIITSGTAASGLLQPSGTAFYTSSIAYLAQTTNNTSQANKCSFVKWNLADGTLANASFTLQSLYETDDASLFSGSKIVSKLKFGVDDNENFYTLMDHSYISGQLTKTWMIRKAKDGVAGSTLLGSFNIKFPNLDLTDFSGTVIFVVDGHGNMYIKANQKDIIKISP